jgi:RNA polymerase sigma-70 factor (ECF subfamily)
MDRIEHRASLNLMKPTKKTAPAHRDLAATSGLEAFEQAFEEHWPPIYRFLARMVGDPSEAEDLALETFYRLYRRSNHIDSGFNTAGWLHRVAMNLGLHSIRTFRRRLAHELNAGRLSSEDSQSGSPAQILMERQEHDLARTALSKLRPRDSQLLLMRYSGASYREIGDALSLSPTSIGPLLLRAEREFARQYRELGQEDT